jgi:hypothetical protein
LNSFDVKCFSLYPDIWILDEDGRYPENHNRNVKGETMTKKRIYKAVVLSAMITSVTSIEASGYKLPEQSLNSVALGAAYVAHTTGADTAYYNPARMGFLDRDRNYIEGSLTLVHLPSIDFEGAQYLPVPPSGVFLKGDRATKIENIGIGQLH